MGLLMSSGQNFLLQPSLGTDVFNPDVLNALSIGK